MKNILKSNRYHTLKFARLESRWSKFDKKISEDGDSYFFFNFFFIKSFHWIAVELQVSFLFFSFLFFFQRFEYIIQLTKYLKYYTHQHSHAWNNLHHMIHIYTLSKYIGRRKTINYNFFILNVQERVFNNIYIQPWYILINYNRW